ncbi:unnamed protein product [Acanthoscelides obtectus]|uniref:Cathepsin L n=1 Tax=Acanthoscelides obtectus TaxID=200917 RepID=A0A9P0K148_ACAOB|nr:unnamed protein product [Acanthoscelides obtectus]CAK1631491.1 hypothetical protein AOBTE_LOCUS6976 [Acanthoscelides obtectus]
MRRFIFFWFVAGVTTSTDLDQWAQFKSKHGRVYTITQEDRKRFSIFKDNLQKIEYHNAKYEKGEVSYALKITKFADMTWDEFKDFLRNSFGDLLEDNSEKSYESRLEERDEETIVDLPTAVDWNQKGAVTKVKDQGTCGSCWAFSAVGALEAQHLQTNGSLLDLSAQELVDCADATYGNMGCAGGLMDNAFNFVKVKGILTEKEYPYKGISDYCRQKQEGFKIQSYVDVANQDEKVLAKAVAQVGPVSCAMDASYIQLYSHGIIDRSCGCDNARYSLNHGVLVVGYGEENGVQFWLVKNSWGTGWGEDGYFKLRKDDKNTCGIATLSSYPVA